MGRAGLFPRIAAGIYSGQVNPTRLWLLAVLAVLAGAIGFAMVGIWDTAFGRTLPVPWTAAATLLILALALFFWALALRPRILRKSGTTPVSPFVAARTAALAMAASRTGALVAGFYLGAAAMFSSRMYIEAARERLWFSLAAAVAAALVVLAALWLEHICRLPGDDEEDNGNPASARRIESADWVLPSKTRDH